MMGRALYVLVLLIHPPAFRRRFTTEMLCIFDEAAPAIGTFGLLVDGLASLARQWVLRSGLWKLALAGVGACLQVTAGGLIWIAIEPGAGRERVFAGNLESLRTLMLFVVASVGLILLMVVTASLWMRSFLLRRVHVARVGR
jgi:hypothetical protein